MTPQLLLVAMPEAGDRAAIFAQPLTDACAEFEIDTPKRKAAFLGQLAHESGSFRYMCELASGVAYEGRLDLGNTDKGDGPRFRGRGPIQITGRKNYTLCGQALQLDLVNHPELLEQPGPGCRAAGWFWQTRRLNAFADRDAFGALTRAINGGFNGIDDRIAHWLTARRALGL